MLERGHADGAVAALAALEGDGGGRVDAVLQGCEAVMRLSAGRPGEAAMELYGAAVATTKRQVVAVVRKSNAAAAAAPSSPEAVLFAASCDVLVRIAAIMGQAPPPPPPATRELTTDRQK